MRHVYEVCLGMAYGVEPSILERCEIRDGKWVTFSAALLSILDHLHSIGVFVINMSTTTAPKTALPPSA